MRPLPTGPRRTGSRKDRSAPADRWRLRTRGRHRRLRRREQPTQLQNIVERALKRHAGSILVGIDTGGTFTDLVAIIGNEIRVHKVLSTPTDPANAVIRGLREMLHEALPDSVTYSST